MSKDSVGSAGAAKGNAAEAAPSGADLRMPTQPAEASDSEPPPNVTFSARDLAAFADSEPPPPDVNLDPGLYSAVSAELRGESDPDTVTRGEVSCDHCYCTHEPGMNCCARFEEQWEKEHQELLGARDRFAELEKETADLDSLCERQQRALAAYEPIVRAAVEFDEANARLRKAFPEEWCEPLIARAEAARAKLLEAVRNCPREFLGEP